MINNEEFMCLTTYIYIYTYIYMHICIYYDNNLQFNKCMIRKK